MFRLSNLSRVAAARVLPKQKIAAAASMGHSSARRSMCGLLAAIDDVWTGGDKKGDIPILSSETVLSKTSQILHHRGPDGMLVSRGTMGFNNQRWSMGHTRLAIVDPTNRKADMPFNLQFGPKTIHLAANGEIYNHNLLYDEITNGADGWHHPRQSGSDCEVIAHAYAHLGGPAAVAKLDGMFAFVIFEEDQKTGQTKCFAARDPVGIKPLYYGRTSSAADANDASAYMFASELKALVGHVDPSSVVAIPPGHYWTPESGLVCYYNPEWLRNDDYAPWDNFAETHQVTPDEIRSAFTKAVSKRMMSDVDYGFFLSGGVDSCVVAHDLLPLYREQGDDRPIKTYTVGMENSPDVMAARAMVDALGGSKYVNHSVRTFTPEEVFDLIPKIVYHMETYEAELIRSAIPNWLLAERAAQDVKMVLTGEGADELFAGYLYFQDAESPKQVQDELRRIYGMLGNINLHRTDRMTMAHGLEARVPFLDTEFSRLVMSVDPKHKMVDAEAVKTNSRGREKTLLRELFEGPNANGDSIPRPALWRAKAMQCEGVGEDWVSILQRKIASLVSDAEMADAHITYPVNTPHTKEELYYRKIYDEHYHGMEHVVKLWEGGCRAGGAAWDNSTYTREGLKNVDLLSHSLQQNVQTRAFSTGIHRGAGVPSMGTSPQRRGFSSLAIDAAEEAHSYANAAGYNEFEAWLTSGGDDRVLIKEESGTNKYHIRPQPIRHGDIFRGSCTANPPTDRGYDASFELFSSALRGLEGNELDAALRDVFADQRARLSKVLELPKGAEVVLCPSGSDAEYIPLAIAKSLQKDMKIVSGVTQLQEIGAGSAPAAVGRYFSTHAPLIGRIPEGTDVLSGFEDIDGVAIPARRRDGSIVDAAGEMDDFVETAIKRGNYPLAHGVFGGKTGLRDDQMPPSLDQGATSLGVVDACQGRFSLEELHEWLERDSVVLFTGSKFFQAPPFCGAVIIPANIAEKLNEAPPPQPTNIFDYHGLGAFLTDKELPKCLKSWRPLLRAEDTNNVGLALRWEAALSAMETLAVVPDHDRTVAIDEWSAAVSKMVLEEPSLDPWCVERSIISIRLAKASDGNWLDMEELRDVYRWMSMDVSSVVPGASSEERNALSTPCYIGQPVDVSESYAIVRIALGVESLISFCEDKRATLNEDQLTVKKLAAISSHFDALKKSGL